MKKNYVKYIALAMILCVGFFIGCKDDLPDGWHTIEISGEYLESEGAVGIYVDVPENVPYVYVTRYDSIGPDNYITYQMPSYRVNPEDEYNATYTQQLLSPGKHTIKDPYVNAGKSYKYRVEFPTDSENFDWYESQNITITVPAESNKNDDFANATVTGYNLTWDKETHTFTWQTPPTFTGIPENLDGDNGLSDDYSLDICYGESSGPGEPHPASMWYSSAHPSNVSQESVTPKKAGQTFSVTSISISIGKNGNTSDSTLDISKPYCSYQYEKALSLNLGTHPESVTFPTEAEYFSKFVGTWVQPDLSVTTMNISGAYSTTNSTGAAGISSGTYSLSENGYDLQFTESNGTKYDVNFDNDTLYFWDEENYRYLVKKQSANIVLEDYGAGFHVYDGTQYISFWLDPEGKILDGQFGEEIGAYSIAGNTITLRDLDSNIILTGVVNSESDIFYCYHTPDNNIIIDSSSL